MCSVPAFDRAVVGCETVFGWQVREWEGYEICEAPREAMGF